MLGLFSIVLLGRKRNDVKCTTRLIIYAVVKLEHVVGYAPFWVSFC